MLQTEFETAPEGAATALELVALRRQIDALELRFSQLAASFDASRYWDYDCSNSAMDWIRFNCRMTSTAAADRISVGRHLPKLVESAEAMGTGDIGFAHVTVIARTANTVKSFDETALLPLAKENSPGMFHYKCLHYRTPSTRRPTPTTRSASPKNAAFASALPRTAACSSVECSTP